MTSTHLKNKHRDLRAKRSSALIITLVVMVLITLLVVSLSSMVGIERVTSHSSFENEKARQFGQMAIDEALTTLKDNIPASNQWAAAPGHLYVYSSQTTYSNVKLYSGDASGSNTTNINLNAQILGGASTASYPIVPSGTAMNVAWVEVAQDGTLVRSTASTYPGTAGTAANPIIGRYAYWVDTENGKANINTAGKGQVYYNPITNVISYVQPSISTYLSGSANLVNSNWASADEQNLSGSPSRLDLSQLDGGITTNQSVATYHYTYGGYYAGDYLSNYTAWVTNANTCPIVYYPNSGSSVPGNAMGYGLGRFNSIWDWAQLPTTDPLSGNSVAAITQAQIETNKFNITVKGRTPEVTPWGLNKMWLQFMPAQLTLSSSVAVAGSSAYGNLTNARGPSGTVNGGFPLSAIVARSFPPNISPSDAGFLTDTRFYCYPWNPATVASTPTPDGQWIGPYGASTFITNFMKQLQRRDWPGMPAKSFEDKYGRLECEDLAYDLYWFWGNTVGEQGPNPSGFGGGLPYDPQLHYGQNVQAINATGTTGAFTTSTSTGKLTNGHLALATGIEAPYINEIAVTFTPTTAGYTPITSGTQTVQQTGTLPNKTITLNLSDGNAILQTTTAGGPMWTTFGGYTKDGTRPGFVPGIYSSTAITGTTFYYLTQSTSGAYMNVSMAPYIQVYYPPGFKDTWFSSQTSYYILDILVTATGQWTPPPVVIGGVTTPQATLTVVYGGTSSLNDSGVPGHYGKTANGGAQYYWGYPDDHPSVIPTTATGTSTYALSGQANGLQLRNVSNGQTLVSFTPGSYATLGYGTFSSGSGSGSGWTPSPIYIGPFDAGSKPTVKIQFRTVSCAPQQNTATTPLQIIPLGANYGNAVSTTKPAGFGSASTAGTEGIAYTNVLNPVGTSPYSGTLSFPYTFGLPLNLASQQSVAYEAVDPREWKYVQDWTFDSNPVGQASTPSGYYTGISPGTSFTSYSRKTTYDPINTWVSSTTPEDDSKFAFPQAPYNEFTYGLGAAFATFRSAIDPRWSQFANNITSLPGIGWLSLIPLNIEASQGVPGTSETSGGSGSSSNLPVPWRTLSLGPIAANDNNLPDWLILEAFAVAYDQTYLSQTDGKVNVNANIYPFSFGRGEPLAALIQPAAYTNTYDTPTLGLTSMTNDLASSSLSGNGDYTAVTAWSVPDGAFVYPGQIAQMSSLQNTAATSGNATNQWQRESVMRNIIGSITTKCSDYKVHVYAQSVKQATFSGSVSTDASNLVVTGEQRMSAIISRETNVGPDLIPSSSDDPSAITDGTITSYITYYPGFKYVISDIEYVNY